MSELHVSRFGVELPVFEVHGWSLRKSMAKLGRQNRFAEGADGSVIVRALNDVSFELKRGDRLGLIGQNGAGKNTLLRVLAGIYKPTRDAVLSTGRTVLLLRLRQGRPCPFECDDAGR